MPSRREGMPLLTYWRRASQRLQPSRVDPRSIAFFAVLLGLIGLAGWLYLAQASEVASYAHEIRMLQRRKEQLHRELVVLRGQVAQRGALGRVMEIGADLGYRLPDAADREHRLWLEYQIAEASAPNAPEAVPSRVPDAAPLAERSRIWLVRLVGESWDQLRFWLEQPPDAGSLNNTTR